MTNEFLAFAPISTDATALDPATSLLDEMIAELEKESARYPVRMSEV